MSYAKRQRRISLIISLVGAALFLVITLTTIVWATGLRFDKATGSFETTAVIAVNNSLSDVTVALNGKVVGNATPITLDGLPGGRYDLAITRAGFYPYDRIFQLSPGQAGVVKKAILIAQEPQITDAPAAVYRPNSPFDIGLVFQNGQLIDFGSLVSRFASPLVQAHRLDTSYLYQQGNELHLFFAENNQDFTIYQAGSSDRLNFNIDTANWQLTIFDGPTAKEIDLLMPSAATGP
ncbi:MAG TPA: PEGA domain-containing protein [Candidatus Saccharimonadales bacterium]|nr:PEGA domain-containing protein [Candidatus Saccharimonadales bacterium]